MDTMSTLRENLIHSYMATKTSKKETYELAEKCDDGVMFHAWNWSFNSIKNNIKYIAESGFTTIQVSPVQPIKEYDLKNTCDWWKFYQPTDFSVGNILGNENEFKEMCNEASTFGVKIIVDVVTNHLANNTGKGNNAKWDRNDKIPAYLKSNDNFWHPESDGAFNYNDNDRTSMTQGAIGMPGLNTASKELQNIIINFLNHLQSLGASGFRFDAAKHIELPCDNVSSDYWPSITEGIKAKDSDSFIYGEILNECGTDIRNYSKYMKVTDNQYGWNVLDSVIHCNAGLSQNYVKNDLPENLITWVESHDTFAGDYGRKSDTVSDEDILLGWCIVASRANTIPLFFARPCNGMRGEIDEVSNNAWRNKSISSVNYFHNHFAGQSEYIRNLNYNSVFEIERGDSGVVIVNLSHMSNKIYTETTLKDGEYTDKISGKNIVVKDGFLSAEINGKSVIVAYNSKENKEEMTFENGWLYSNKPNHWGKKIYAYVYTEKNGKTENIVNWPGVEMKLSGNYYSYHLPKAWQNECTKVIFNDGCSQIPFAHQSGANYTSYSSMYFDGNRINCIQNYDTLKFNKEVVA